MAQSHIQEKICLIGRTLVRKQKKKKKRKVRPRWFLENKISRKSCWCHSLRGYKALLYVVSFPRQSGPFHKQGPQRPQAKENRHKTAFLPGCCVLTDVTVKPRQWCYRLNRVDVVKKRKKNFRSPKSSTYSLFNVFFVFFCTFCQHLLRGGNNQNPTRRVELQVWNSASDC